MAATNNNNNGFELFGYRIGKVDNPQDDQKQKNIPSFAPPPNDDGAFEFAPGGAYGTFVDLEGTAKTESELVTRYRDLSMQAEVESAIEDIVNEAIVRQENKQCVQINMDSIKIPEKIKQTIREEFKTVLQLLDFENNCYDIFRRWYVDGRLYYHKMIDETKPAEGIKELRYIDPRRIRKVREMIRKPLQPGIKSQSAPPVREYYLYVQPTVNGLMANQGIRISKDSIAYVHSGLMDQRNRMILSYLHKAIKPMNQLRMLEDAVVIYRLARAPERRIFYIDVGNLPKMKAEQYIRDMMVKHKNRLVYDAATGEIRDDRKFMTMLEDFWLPRREGGKGTEITTLQGGQNLGQMEDVDYFRQKLYKSLNVPITRLQADQSFNLGRTGEITRDEVKFSKFIDRLRTRFSQLFNEILETQLLLRGVMTREEWNQMKPGIHYDYLRDNYYAEVKEQEVMNSRLGILQSIDPFVGKYYSIAYIRKNVLKQTEEDIAEMNEDMEKELAQQQEMMANDPNNQPQQQAGGGNDSDSDPQVAATMKQVQPQNKKQQVSEEDLKILREMQEILDENFEILND